jgi:hypothetical protein
MRITARSHLACNQHRQPANEFGNPSSQVDRNRAQRDVWSLELPHLGGCIGSARVPIATDAATLFRRFRTRFQGIRTFRTKHGANAQEAMPAVL